MEENTKTVNLLLPIGILFVLLAIGGVILYYVIKSGESQAPEETAAADNKGGTAACGEDCKGDGDCIDTDAAGFPVVCNGGKCRSSLCPDDNSQGTICSCTTLATCGHRCGYGSSKGSCESGSVCVYVTGPSCAATYDNTYCVPTDNDDVKTPKCVSRDTNNSYLKLASNTSKTSFTAAEVQALCDEDKCGNGKVNSNEECDPDADPTGCDTGEKCKADCTCKVVTPSGGECGDGTIDTGEECDIAASPNGCASGKSCSSECICYTPATNGGVSALPKTALIDEQTDKYIISSVLILSGIFTILLGRKKLKNNIE